MNFVWSHPGTISWFETCKFHHFHPTMIEFFFLGSIKSSWTLTGLFAQELDLVQMKRRGSRVTQRKRAFEIPESKLLFVIRIHGWVLISILLVFFDFWTLYANDSNLFVYCRCLRRNDMHPKTRHLMYSLGLRQMFSGVFVKANDRIVKILHKLEPYITYG